MDVDAVCRAPAGGMTLTPASSGAVSDDAVEEWPPLTGGVASACTDVEPSAGDPPGVGCMASCVDGADGVDGVVAAGVAGAVVASPVRTEYRRFTVWSKSGSRLLRGRGRSMGTDEATRPGFELSTTTLSAICTACPWWGIMSLANITSVSLCGPVAAGPGVTGP